MAKFKTDGFKIAKDFMTRGIYTDVRVYKDRNHIEVIAVKDSMIITGKLMPLNSTWSSVMAFNKFQNQSEVDAVIDNFIKAN